MDKNVRQIITKKEFDNYFSLGEGFDNSDDIYIKDREFNFLVKINPIHKDIKFENCLFRKKVYFEFGEKLVEVVEKDDEEMNDKYFNKVTNVFDKNITFNNKCEFLKKVSFKNIIFKGKVRIHDSCLNKVDFENTTFENLLDFWKTEFKKPTTFYKTDFKSTTVFSFAKFHENVLFTYSLFAGKTIFARTNFIKGLDVSQTIIKGNLQLFDLRFDFKNYKSEYIGENHVRYQDSIDHKAIIPLVNKVHTFQILKKGFIDIGNYSDSILMQREEKRALRELTDKRFSDKNVDTVNFGDKIILWLNRWSNNYQSDFRNGIWFTLAMVVF